MKKIDKIFLVFLVFFLLTRLSGWGLVYHQDEYKWAILSAQGQFNPIHPPLASFLFQSVGQLIGFEYLRLVPIIFSLLTFVLVYLLVRRQYGLRAARFSSLILLSSSYNLLASVQIDIDGALLPFFVVLACLAFSHLNWQNWQSKENYWWGVVFFLALIGGFLTKLSFVILVATLLTEVFLIRRPSRQFIFWLGGAGVVVALLIWNWAPEIFNYVKRFTNFNWADRNWSQVLFLTIKSLILTSPLLLGGYFMLVGRPGVWSRYRLWFIFLFYNLIFYYVFFDFSHGGTIERYLMFLIIPSVIITGAAIDEHLQTWIFWPGTKKKLVFIVGTLLTLWAVSMSLSVRVLPLQPKQVYLDQFKHLNLDFLIPITGGSGPSGFYVLAMLVAGAVAISFIALTIVRWSRRESFGRSAFLVWLVVGILYNLILGSELVSGWQYGNVTRVTKEAIAAVVSNQTIPEVITYYDIGGYELRTADKYRNRFYTDPMFTSNAAKFAAWEGHFLVVDFPEINKDSVYWRYFLTCETVQEWQDKLVKAYIFDCQTGDRSLFK